MAAIIACRGQLTARVGLTATSPALEHSLYADKVPTRGIRLKIAIRQQQALMLADIDLGRLRSDRAPESWNRISQ
jgi:aspartate/glutamate racemase